MKHIPNYGHNTSIQVSTKWRPVPIGNNVHVIPEIDSEPHYPDRCPCDPRTELELYGAVIIHNAFDGRTTGDAAKILIN